MLRKVPSFARNPAEGAGSLVLWIASDDLRKGAVINAVQIAELLMTRGSL